jgi:N-acetylglucosamine-6-phosphate deacetylase
MKGVFRKNAYRTAGAVEAGLFFDDLYVEIIADGRHLPTSLLKFIYKCKGADKICLITDGTRASGYPDGKESFTGSRKNGAPCIVENGVAFLPDRQSFAGSVATTDRLVRTMHFGAGIDISKVSVMASKTPAKVLGLCDRGEIKEGLRADLVILDNALNVKKVYLNGKAVN